MGVMISKIHKLFDGFSAKNPARIIMLGLDAAGKTTILYKLKLNEAICTIPTIGFNVETVQPFKGVSFTVWDVGGQQKIRRLWEYYFQNTEGIIFVVDSADAPRVYEAKDELFAILRSDQMQGIPLVVIANKQDLPGSLRPYELVEGLELRTITDRKWHIQGTCATNGDGLYEALETLSHDVKEYRKNKKHGKIGAIAEQQQKQ